MISCLQFQCITSHAFLTMTGQTSSADESDDIVLGGSEIGRVTDNGVSNVNVPVKMADTRALVFGEASQI